MVDKSGPPDGGNDFELDPPPMYGPPPPPTPRPLAPPPDPLKRLFGWLYTHNPFYVISAWLVFAGLRSSFDPTGDSFQTDALMAGLAGYTALLALAAVLLIRLGRVWQDARTMLLLVVLLMLAISVCFDETLARDPGRGVAYYLTGWLFSAVVSEAMLRGMPLRLPLAYRVPYHLALALFFFYPLLVSRWVESPWSGALQWSLFGFSSVAGLVTLTLIPAIRRGRRYVRDNGSPWPWPQYPWSLFVFLAVGVLARAYYLCVSLHFVVNPTNIFGYYFWAPFLLAINVLLVEFAATARQRQPLLNWIALLAPLVTLTTALGVESSFHANLRFPDRFAEFIGGTPLFATTVGVAVVYGWCTLRRLRHAADAFSLSLLLLAVVTPTASGWDTITPWSPQVLPLCLLSVVQGIVAVRRYDAVRYVYAAIAGCVALSSGLTLGPLDAGDLFVPGHLILALALVIGAVVRNDSGRLVQHIAAVLIFAAAADSTVFGPGVFVSSSNAPDWVVSAYPALAIVVALVYGYLLQNAAHFAAAAGVAMVWLSDGALQLYRWLRETMAGLDYLLWGLIAFALALGISVSKIGKLRKWLRARRRLRARGG